MTTHAPSSARSRQLALIVLCSGMLMIILDGSIVTVALPAIQQDLGFSAAGLTWTVNAYLIAFGGLLLLAGRLGDLIGRKRVFVGGLAVFTAASLLCGVSTSQETLIVARLLQGAGGAAASAVSLGMIVTIFTDPGERAKAIGAFSFVGAAGASIGQVLGGVLTDALGWHWIFFINLPVGLIAILFAIRVLDAESGPGLRAGADATGAVLVTAGLMIGVYAIVGVDSHGWSSPRTLGLGVLSVLLLAGFVLRQRHAAHPLLPLRILRSRTVSAANVIQLLLVAAGFGFQITIAMYMQKVLGYGAAATGLALLPAAVAIGVAALGFSARLIARFGQLPVLLAGLGSLVVAMGLLVRLPVEAHYVTHLLPTMLLVGGFGLAISALTALAMSDAAPDDAGVTSGLFNTTQQVGGALGVAVLSTLAAARADGLLADGAGSAAALTEGFRLAFSIGTGLLAVAFVLAVTLLRARRPAAVPLAR